MDRLCNMASVDNAELDMETIANNLGSVPGNYMHGHVCTRRVQLANGDAGHDIQLRRKRMMECEGGAEQVHRASINPFTTYE